MFLGTFSPKLDDKGRFFLPAKFRAELERGLVMTRGQERCVYVFSADGFQEVHDRVRSAPITSKQARDFLRVFLSGASDEIPDKQLRVKIPAHLRDYAGLGRDLVVIGAGTRAEIWDAAAWQSYLDEQEQAFSDIEEEVIPGMF